MFGDTVDYDHMLWGGGLRREASYATFYQDGTRGRARARACACMRVWVGCCPFGVTQGDWRYSTGIFERRRLLCVGPLDHPTFLSLFLPNRLLLLLGIPALEWYGPLQLALLASYGFDTANATVRCAWKCRGRCA